MRFSLRTITDHHQVAQGHGSADGMGGRAGPVGGGQSGQEDQGLLPAPAERAEGMIGVAPQVLALLRQPVLVFETTKETLTTAHARALSRSLPRAIFTSDLFTTGNDRDNRAAVRAVATNELDLVGMAVYGPRNAVDKVIKGARMHP